MNNINKTDLLLDSKRKLIEDCKMLALDFNLTFEELQEENQIQNVENCFQLLDYLEFATNIYKQRLRLYNIQQSSIAKAKFK